MKPQDSALTVVCDDGHLSAGACVPDRSKGVIVLLHGIPSVSPPVPGDAGYPGMARRAAEDGWLAVWGDMRAVRASEGYFSIDGWVRDAAAIVDAARSIDGAAGLPLGVIGSSAGGAVALEAARRGAPIDALALLAAPADWVSFAAGDPAEGVRRVTQEAGMALAPEVLADPSAWAEEFDRVTAEVAAAEVKIPMLVVHGTADETVPVDHARRIARRAPHARLVILDGAPHQLRKHPGVLELVLDWLDDRWA
ncbi:MAG: alpha/beta hydrolase family protein [Actinomycetota bacterium]